MRVWLNDPDWKYNPQGMEVKREYNHFDFCVCDKYSFNETSVTGNVKVVLENKFKSIAYKSQLLNYKNRTKTLNEEAYKNKFEAEKKQQGDSKARLPRNWRDKVEQTDMKYILLTLAKDFLDKDSIKELGWTIVPYSEYSKLLRENLKLITDDFYHNIIEHYCDFIDIFSAHLNDCLNNIKITDGWDILKRADFASIRCNDVWQKLVMHKCAMELGEKLKDCSLPVIVSCDKEIWGKNGTENKDKLFLVVNFFHSEAMFELKYLIPGKGIFALQQQGAHPLRVGFLDMTSPKPRFSKKDDIANWNKEAKRIIEEAGIGEEIIPMKNVQEESKDLYNSYGTFYYNEYTGERKNIGDTLDEMVAIIKKVIKQ